MPIQKNPRTFQTTTTLCTLLAIFASIPIASAEQIDFQTASSDVMAGDPVSLLVIIRENSTPLVSYSLNVDVEPVGDAVGALSADIAETNLFPARNLIETDPDDSLDPVFSVISDPGDGGVFINAQSLSGTPVALAQPGFSDVLAEVVFDVPPDALGTFRVSLGTGSTLFNGANEVPFDTQFLDLIVVPEPVSAILLGLGGLLIRRR